MHALGQGHAPPWAHCPRVLLDCAGVPQVFERSPENLCTEICLKDHDNKVWYHYLVQASNNSRQQPMPKPLPLKTVRAAWHPAWWCTGRLQGVLVAGRTPCFHGLPSNALCPTKLMLYEG